MCLRNQRLGLAGRTLIGLLVPDLGALGLFQFGRSIGGADFGIEIIHVNISG